MTVDIQIADISHAPAITRLSREALGYDYPEAATAENLASILESPGDRVFVALIQVEVVGYVHACDYQVLYAPAMKNIMGIAVDASHRREGIGTALLTAVENWAQQSGAAGVRLVSGASRAQAHLFYRSLGYGDGRQQRNFKKYFQGISE